MGDIAKEGISAVTQQTTRFKVQVLNQIAASGEALATRSSDDHFTGTARKAAKLAIARDLARNPPPDRLPSPLAGRPAAPERRAR